MPYYPTEPERTLPSLAVRKRKAAERREAEAATLRAEADEYDRRWQEHVAKRNAARAVAS